MKETRADAARAFGYAIGLHALLFMLAFIGLWWTRVHPPSAAAGAPVEAELIDAASLSAAMRQVLSERPQPASDALPVMTEDTVPPPQPEPEPLPQDMPEPPQPIAQEQLPVPDIEEQVPESPFAQAQAEVERMQEERRRQEQVDLTEAEKQQQAQRLRRLTAMEQQRLEQLEDIRQRAEAAAQAAQEKLEELAQRRARSAAEEAAVADASASGPKGVIDLELLARYKSAIMEAVERNWTRPDSVQPGMPCKVLIVQIPGGEVISAEVVAGCPYDEVGRRSIEAAVLRAQPLPYAGFESVYSRELIFTFRAPD